MGERMRVPEVRTALQGALEDTGLLCPLLVLPGLSLGYENPVCYDLGRWLEQ